MAFKQDCESTVIDNLETATDNQCLPLSHHIMSIDKTARMGFILPVLKIKMNLSGLVWGMISGVPKLVCAPVSLTKEVQAVRNFREIQIIESSQNGLGSKGP